VDHKCLVCGQNTDTSAEYHPRCSTNFFGRFPPPAIEITLDGLREFAARSVLARITVTGVQKKLSLGVETNGKNSRFTIVGLWGSYILKAPVEEYPEIPENEDAVMRLAGLSGIPVVPHALIRLASGELAYISKRIDRADTQKTAMEDFCQISERLTEDKYRGSMERVGKLLRRYSVYPGLDAVDLFERTIFCFITGNSDMHLKNFSLIETASGMRLSPAYDLVSTALVLPEDSEESALTINGKKARFNRADFEKLAESIEITQVVQRKIFTKFQNLRKKMAGAVRESWLSEGMQERLAGIITERIGLLGNG
jgi:serine/threonine-protein kinase HipA